MTKSSTRWRALAAVFAGQCAVLGWMIAERVHLLTTGQEIVLDVVPVDPRDLFRGDYVRLGYTAERIPRRLFAEPPGHQGAPVYVVLAKDSASRWLPVKAQAMKPATLAKDEIAVRGKIRWPDDRAGVVNVDFGIGSYFVPEGDGLKIESDVAKHQVQVRVSVNGDGKAAIKGLLVGGTSAYTEPLL